MPTSEYRQIPHILEVVVSEQPKTVLDVGAGYGKFGVLAREYGNAERVDCVDVIPPRFPAYDHFYQGDILELNKLLHGDVLRYDLVLFIDVIEHLEKAQAWDVLNVLMRVGRRVLITTPLGFRRQEVEGQPYETHRSGWYPWEFGKHCRIHRLQIFPGHRTRHLRLPRLWQILALVSGPRDSSSRGS